jgi:glycine/D-amino acid oxidase-like deaminating enzyme
MENNLIILGGGLAGLSLARQLKLRLPNIEITVLERRKHPVPEAAFKVGESTVEIGAHYYGEVLRLKKHLERDQLFKLGFFPMGIIVIYRNVPRWVLHSFRHLFLLIKLIAADLRIICEN